MTPIADQCAGSRSGLVLMLGAMIVLPVMDAIAKALSASLAPVEITWGRFFFQTAMTLPFLVVASGWRSLVPNRVWGNALRGVLLALASACFFAAVKYMPLADAMAIFFLEPFVLTVLSVVVERETIGWRRSLAVAVGFLGAVIVIRPSWAVFGWASLLPLATAVLFAFYLLLNKRLARHDTPLAMQFAAGVSGTLVLSVLLLAGTMAGIGDATISRPDGGEWALLAVMGAISAGGHLMVVQAFARAPASLLAPFQYLEIVAATTLGLVWFGDFPDAVTWLGIGVIVLSGLYVFVRERQLAHRAGSAAEEPARPVSAAAV